MKILRMASLVVLAAAPVALIIGCMHAPAPQVPKPTAYGTQIAEVSGEQATGPGRFNAGPTRGLQVNGADGNRL